MNYFSKKKKYIFNINNDYIFNCNLYDEKVKEKINKKREKCLYILSTEDGDDDEDSNDKLIHQKKYFPKTREKSYSLYYRNRKNSVIISSNKVINKNSDSKPDKLNSSKIVSSIYRKFGNKKAIDIKKVNNQATSISNGKIVSNYKKNIGNISHIRKNTHHNLVKSFSVVIKKNNNPRNTANMEKEEKTEVKKNNSPDNKSKKENDNNKEDNIKKEEEEEKPLKIYKFYSSKKIRNHLPNIVSPQKLNYLNKQQFSLNDSENYNIVPIVLPQIGKIKKEKKFHYESNKKIMKMKIMNNDKH
jgi:hypothetical protein